MPVIKTINKGGDYIIGTLIKFKHVIIPPKSKELIEAETGILGLLSTINSFGNLLIIKWNLIVLSWIVVVSITYLICIVIDNYNLKNELLKISENNAGLLKQYDNDKKAKESLQQSVDYLTQINKEASAFILQSSLSEPEKLHFVNFFSIYNTKGNLTNGNENSKNH